MWYYQYKGMRFSRGFAETALNYKLMTSVIIFIAEPSAFLFCGKELITMLLSLAIIFLSALLLDAVCTKIKIPSLLGMLALGILIGPYALNLIDPSLLNISAELRRIALIIILTQAGLNLNIEALKKIGRPAVMMSFLPASFEIIGVLLIAPALFNVTLLDAAIMGSVLAAVSPAVVVPGMLMLTEKRLGTKKAIPQLIMAGASVDDVFVIVLFTAFTHLASGDSISAVNFLRIPTAIINGILFGAVLGALSALFFRKFHIRDSVKVIIILSISFLLVTLEDNITGAIGFSGLLAIMSMGAVYGQKSKVASERISVKYSKLWISAKILLFVLVGATVNINYVPQFGLNAVILIFAAMLFRMAGVLMCLVKTNLNAKERVFCMLSYTPKATVQAAIGSIPLTMGLSCGSLVLTAAVLAILITAPFGAFAIDRTSQKLLEREDM